jgi:hypothetical protein
VEDASIFMAESLLVLSVGTLRLSGRGPVPQSVFQVSALRLRLTGRIPSRLLVLTRTALVRVIARASARLQLVTGIRVRPGPVGRKANNCRKASVHHDLPL